MTDSAGHKIELIRDPKRNLRDSIQLNKTAVKFDYDSKDRIVRAVDDCSNVDNLRDNAKGS